MKNYIQVNNFKKYISTPEIELNDLNFFVGTNSSGKSTLVKAYLLITTFIKSDKLFEIDFSSPEYKDLNIQEFKRQFSYYSDSDEISIDLNIDNILYHLVLCNHTKSNFALVKCYEVVDSKNNIAYCYENINSEQDLKIKFINNEKFKDKIIGELEKDIKKNNDNAILEELNGDLLKIENELNLPDTIINFSSPYSDLPNSFKTSANLILSNKDNLIERGLNIEKILFNSLDNKNNKLEQIISHYRIKFFLDFNRIMQQGGMDMITELSSIKVHFLPLHYRKYTNLNSIVDKSNDLALLIHNYYSVKEKKETQAENFIKFWLGKDQFNIGEDFEINFYGGEAYEFLILENGHKIPLTDKGSGNIQIIKILLIIAAQIKKGEINCTIALEEPELNLHPSIQSKLADLLSQTNKEYKFKFMVETHSEYLIRRLQVLSIHNKLDRDSLGLSYFPSETNQDPYQLKIRNDGSLDKNFGTGFLDEAGNHMLEIMKFNITNKN